MDKKQIADYLWNKAPSHLKDNQPKEQKDTYKLFEIYSGRGYEVREALKASRLNRFPQTANKEALFLLSKERQIEKFDFETTEEFRNRVINALDWHSLKGTVKGIKTILQFYGFEDIKITPVLKTDPQKWSEFEIEIDFTKNINKNHLNLLTYQNLSNITQIINQIKPTYEKLSDIKVKFHEEKKLQLLSTTKTIAFFKAEFKQENSLNCQQSANINTFATIKTIGFMRIG